MGVSFTFASGTNIAIDLGNSNTILTNNVNKPFSYPSFIVFNKNNNAVKAVGKEAYDMAGKTSQELKVVKPLKGGVIKDFDSASKMLRALVNTTHPGRNLFSRFNTVISGVPYSTTEVEKRALRDTLAQFNSSKTYLLHEPIAAAIGMGLDIQVPNGNFIVDIGGGITEVVVISLSGIVNFNSIRAAGDSFDADIQDYFRRNYQVEIGLNMAEQLKLKVGAAWDSLKNPPEPVYLIGKSTIEGIPTRIKVDHREIAYILNSSITKIEQLIIQTLEECPPELAGDIYGSGIHLTGGGALLRGLRDRLEAKVKIPVHQDHDALLSVTKGILTVMNNMEKYRSVLIK